MLYCDDCETELDKAECDKKVHSLREQVQTCDDHRHAVASLPSDIAHAKAGEAAVLCGVCYRWLSIR